MCGGEQSRFHSGFRRDRREQLRTATLRYHAADHRPAPGELARAVKRAEDAREAIRVEVRKPRGAKCLFSGLPPEQPSDNGAEELLRRERSVFVETRKPRLNLIFAWPGGVSNPEGSGPCGQGLRWCCGGRGLGGNAASARQCSLRLADTSAPNHATRYGELGQQKTSIRMPSGSKAKNA